MKLETKWISKKIKYDGSQMHSLYSYLNHQVLGDSVIAFRGPCDVQFSEMLDGEDLLAESAIRGSDMVHFIFEIFDQNLFSAVLLQRLFTSIVAEVVFDLSKGKIQLCREGDDLYDQKRKFSISIAAKSPQSSMIHFAVNVSDKGTPVATVGLHEMKLKPELFATKCLQKVAREYSSILMATQKVKPLS